MQKIFLIVVMSLIVLSNYAGVSDRIVAKVGREIILQSELDKQVMQMKNANMMKEGMTDTDVLDQMIETKLIILKAKDLKLEADEFKIKSMAEKQMKEVQAQFKSEDEFRAELKKMGLSVLDLKKYYEDMLTEQSLKEQIINTEIKKKAVVTNAEVEQYYNENKAQIPNRPPLVQVGMIMKTIKAGEETKKNALLEINKIMDKLNRGEDFEALAKKNSDDPSSKSGGDIGFFSKGMMVKSFEDASFALKPGQISKVVETRFGYHIIKMEEKKGDEIRVRHILKMVLPLEKDIDTQVSQMQGVLDDLKKGASFAEMAKKYSEDDSSAANGGVIGEFTDENYPEMFKENLAKIGVGEYTELIRQEDMIYIFTKTKMIPERQYEFNEIQDKIKEMVISRKQLTIYEQWIDNLKKEIYVEIKKGK